MSFLDFYEKVQDRFSYEGAKELYKFLKEMRESLDNDIVDLVVLSENYKEFQNWREAKEYFKMSKAEILDEYLIIPCVDDHVVIEIN